MFTSTKLSKPAKELSTEIADKCTSIGRVLIFHFRVESDFDTTRYSTSDIILSTTQIRPDLRTFRRKTFAGHVLRCSDFGQVIGRVIVNHI